LLTTKNLLLLLLVVHLPMVSLPVGSSNSLLMGSSNSLLMGSSNNLPAFPQIQSV
jgi:hypothetical protein